MARATGIVASPRDPAVLPLLVLARALAWYHRHRVQHLERLGNLLLAGRRVVVVGNHALDLIDPLMFVAAVLESYGRIPRFIGHENIVFNMPLLASVARHWRVIPSRAQEEAFDALRRDGFLMLFPGAGSEALRRDYRAEPYRLKWEGRTGFLQLALELDAEIVFVAAVGNDDMYYQSRLPIPGPVLAWLNHGDAARYRGALMQFGLAGPHLLPGLVPLPVRITHVVSPPLSLGNRRLALKDPVRLRALHRRVWKRCQNFLDRAVAAEHATSDPLDRTVRSLMGLLRGMGL
jgi:1-acyl-sn-glycerol-3-phosphate acyltransferase